MAREGRDQLSAGQMVADRYLIRRCLGKGSMGEVYLANDMKLRESVALKLPPKESPNLGRLQARLYSEVSLARAVAHPNVCKMYDLDVVDGVPLLKMEYIEGETLEGILERTVGALTGEEKLRVAHELCAGLEAIHKCGIVHFDLKPSNIMLDARCRTVITDFGIADSVELVAEKQAGTPSYMAPEQIDGDPTSPACDVFSLGTVLYELFMGEPAYDGKSRATRPRLLDDDEIVEHKVRCVIEECLDPRPERRPTPREVSERLPVAPLDSRVPMLVDRLLRWPPYRGLDRARAWLSLTIAGAALVGVVHIAASTQLTSGVLQGDSPAVLEARARDLLEDLGFGSSAGRKETSGFTYEPAHLGHVTAHDGRSDRWRRVIAAPHPPIAFWYRQSPVPIVPKNLARLNAIASDPPHTVAGMVGVHLDGAGRLLRLDAVPSSSDETGDGPSVIDGEALLTAAGLDPGAMRSRDPRWIPSVFADQRLAWEGPSRVRGGGNVRVEVAALRGQPVSFRLVEPWSASETGPPEHTQFVPPRFVHVFVVWFVGVLLVCLWSIRKHWTQGVADRDAAFTLSGTVFCLMLTAWLLSTRSLPAAPSLNALLLGIAQSLLIATLLWLIYGAMEPLVRREWPKRTASWVRLLYGRVRDPLVGRDLLAGISLAIAWVLWAKLYAVVPGWLGWPPPRPDALGTLIGWNGQSLLDIHLHALRGFRQTLSAQIFALVWGTLSAFFAVVMVVFIRKATGRHAWAGRAGALLVLAAISYPAAGHHAIDACVALGASALWLTALVRFGFLVAATMSAFGALLSSHPLTFDLGAWHAPGAIMVLTLTVGVMAWGAYYGTDRASVPKTALENDQHG